jgi:hypothetical protein
VLTTVLGERVGAENSKPIAAGHTLGPTSGTPQAAFWPQRGQSLLDLAGDGPFPPWIVARDDGALGITDDFELARDSLCADLDRDRAREMFSHTVLQSAAALGTPSTAPDRKHPTTYMIAAQESGQQHPGGCAGSDGGERR